MQGEPGRALRAGVLVCFRLKGTMELLWKARMSIVPRDDDRCVVIADEEETRYKVERVRWDFLRGSAAEIIGYDEGVPIYGDYVPTAMTQTGPVVIVSEV